MKSLIIALFTSLLRLIGERLLALAQDRRIQALALKAVEAAAGLDLDGDGKRDHARAELQAEAIAIGKVLAKSEANALIELAVSKIKEDAEKTWSAAAGAVGTAGGGDPEQAAGESDGGEDAPGVREAGRDGRTYSRGGGRNVLGHRVLGGAGAAGA